MQRGIDSFFKRVPSKSGKDASPIQKKRKVRAISSDEDEIPESSHIKNNGNKLKKARTNVEATSPKTKQQIISKKLLLLKSNDGSSADKTLHKIDPASIFDGETKRVEAKKPPEPRDNAILELEDDAIDLSLLEVDVDKSLLMSAARNTPDKALKPQDLVSPPKRLKHPEPQEFVKTNAVKTEQCSTTQRNKKATQIDLETSVLSDEERHERKRMAAMAYQKYKNRSSCLNPGSKKIPKGTPNCLKGSTFLVTGILESMERKEVESVIKEHGGRVMTVVGKKLNYLLVGEEAGLKKLAQAEEHNVKILSEDGLLNLIRERSGIKMETVNPDIEISKSSKIKEEPRESTNTAEKIWNIKRTPSAVLINIEPPIESNNNGQHANKLVDSIAIDKAWVDKYKPTSVKEIIGQAGAASNVSKLMNWLSKWFVNQDGTKKLARPNPWAKNDDGSFYKAALLSGPPGIGKTTTAGLVGKELGYDVVEFNASDTRSKRLLKDEVSSLLSNQSLYGFVNGKSQVVSKKHLLIMDEVDGMAGNEDRGGVQELIALIKDSSVPIICICNDRNHTKMRSLVNYCYDLRFPRPRMEQIKGRLLSICCRENFKLPAAKLEELIAATNNDIRQCINHISLLSAGEQLELKKELSSVKVAEKDLKLGPWEVVRKVFAAEEHKHMSEMDKCDLFFHDYSLAPLFVQQNYLQVTPVGSRDSILKKVAAAAECLSLGDLVDKRIRNSNAWSLLPTQAAFCSFLPGEYMCGHFTGQINFPAWLGKNSKSNKRSRLAQELHDHTRICTSGSRLSMRLDYAPYLIAHILKPLRDTGLEGVQFALDIIKQYHLLREDLESLLELTAWPGKKSPMEVVDGRVKAALTRAYNKDSAAYSYSVQAGIKKKRDAACAEDDELLGLECEGEEISRADSEDEEKDLESDGLIKNKSKKSTRAAKTTSSSKSTAIAVSKKSSVPSTTKSAATKSHK